MTFGQAMEGVWGQRLFMDWFGLTAASGECTLSSHIALPSLEPYLNTVFPGLAAYLTIWPEDGIMRMEDVRGVLDGSYLYQVAGDRRTAYSEKEMQDKIQSKKHN